MKIVAICIATLVVVSFGYLYIIQPQTRVEEKLATTDFAKVDMFADSMCTSTACMKKEASTKVASQTTPVTTVVPYTEFVDPNGFINSEPFRLADYIGKKIILIEFITYSCINCQRTFPYMQQWHETYEREGLLVIGIHTPEFAYERDRDNVIAAMQKEGITFPIVQDNDYQTWNAYKNRFWPHRYVIDYKGQVVFDHIGEGAYSETEEVIKKLLANKPSGT